MNFSVKKDNTISLSFSTIAYKWHKKYSQNTSEQSGGKVLSGTIPALQR